MDKLNIDFKSLLPHVIDAFTEVYGEEYRSIISERINSSVIISYYDIEGLNNYLSYIKRCKRREFAVKFLDKIGLDVKKYIQGNYTQPLDNEIERVLEHYMYSSFHGFEEDTDYWVPLQAFKRNNEAVSSQILRNKIKIVNYLLGDSHEHITEETFELFTKTNEYQNVLKKIDYLNIIYEKLLLEYREWETQLQPYEEYIQSEKKRKDDILRKKKISMFTDIFSSLPISVKNAISNKSIEEQCNTVLGSGDISSRFIIESFRDEQMQKLNSKDVEPSDKFWIVYWQTNYLKRLGVIIPNKDMLDCDSEEDIADYLDFLTQDNVRKYIPSKDLISYISTIREKSYKDALREYYMTREDIVDVMKIFGNDENNVKYIYEQVKNKRVCIAGQGATCDGEFISLMFYTIRRNDGGSLFHSFMHENGHIIDQNPKGCGFESSDNFIPSSEDYRENPYDNAFRIYEKFNETLNDIFTIEAIEFLQRQGIFLIEPKEFTLLDISNHNTALITKNLLYPLVQRFRQQVIKAKINADRDELIKCIGKENFEELVDVVNKVDYLSRNGVVSKIDTCPEDEMVKDYFKQVERVKEIYSNIDNYNNIDSLSSTLSRK